MITGSEDKNVGYYDGPVFKLNKNFNDHTGFINCTRFRPDGKTFVSVSSDKVN